MNTIQNLAMIKDLVNLPKDVLKEICLNSNLSTEGIGKDLANRIWERVRESKELQNSALEIVKDKIVAGKTSVTWYNTTTSGNLIGAKDLIIRNNNRFNPFERVIIPQLEAVTSTPVLIGAAHGDTEHEYYLRFIYKYGVGFDYYRDMVSYPKTRLCTAYINEQKGIVEVRAEPKVANEIAATIFALINQRTFMEQFKVLAPFGEDVEKFADALDGEVIDTSSKPDVLLDDFSNEQAVATVDILGALDDFFATDDIESLKENLVHAQEIFGENLLETPFTAIILAGLQKVSMGSDKELRGQPLYDFLRPYLQHQSGFIRFSYPENGVLQSYTIRVGLKANSIFFVSAANESVINYIRDKIIYNN
ncbi:hypothetical protein [Bacillus paranthracis]|uniref:Uncharacterized protein n=1 Tax=Bacillus paranthracis TaxID=2026186 RepID=A0A9X8SDR9_9BACI|nr:hypothetical protein [Bacillus paranthracis]MCR6792059.1 hypothetical protein [Bacillus paranthracis]MDR4163795.1 hypothetical protein [Bacillus paranthracis]MED1168905.1 hypothetical protein [Bacillus paranthracis]SME05981.1 hypothetical protein BACERE00221_02362 [Bacillus paranthracis]